MTAGEVHLQRCLLDLTETFAKCELSVSEPLVPFRETVVKPPDTDMVNQCIEAENKVVRKNEEEEEGVENSLVTIETLNKQCQLSLQVFPLPAELTKLLEDNVDLLRAVDRDRGGKSVSLLTEKTLQLLADLRHQVSVLMDKDPDLAGLGDSVWCVGPRRCGPNMLINRVTGYRRGSLWSPDIDKNDPRSDLDSSLVNGFQLATLAGPLCDEPMMGVAIVVSRWDVADEGDSVTWGPLSGQVMSSVKEGCRRAFQSRPQRLMVAMYSCNIQVRSECCML